MASCTAHGKSTRNTKLYRNYTPYASSFYKKLLADRVWIFEGTGRSRNLVQGVVFGADGKNHLCGVKKKRKQWVWLENEPFVSTWEAEVRRDGVRIKFNYEHIESRYMSLFYDPNTGGVTNEIALRDKYGRFYWKLADRGQLQASWPRSLVDACPGLKLPGSIRINEKQASLKMDELRRQDPDAPIRNFPGSQHTGPGRTGLAASGGRPTTSKEEVEAWMKLQKGNVLVSARGNGYVFTEGWGEGTEIWLIGYDGNAGAFGKVTRKTDRTGQEWVISDLPGVGTVKYAMGYPLPLMSTGHRHPAWQITDWLIESGRVLEVPDLGDAWKGVRFHPENRAEVFPADGGAPVTGGWRWTKTQLQVWLSDGPSAVEHWRDLAKRLNMGVTIWTPDTPNTGT